MTHKRARRTALAVLVLSSVAGPAVAQSPEHPLLTLSTSVGYLTGGKLWHLDRQLAAVRSGETDSVALSREFRPGFQIGLGATLFRSPHVAYAVELSFLSMTTESGCAPLGPYAFDTSHINQQACEDIQGERVRTSAATVQGGLTWRANPEGRTQPYVRAVGGLAVLGGSFVATAGSVLVPGSIDSLGPPRQLRIFLDEKNRRGMTWVATLAAGATLEMSPGYQLRFEARDVLTNVPVVTGPADPLAIQPYAQVGSRTVHLLALTVGLDIVLERQRSRRY